MNKLNALTLKQAELLLAAFTHYWMANQCQKDEDTEYLVGQLTMIVKYLKGESNVQKN